MGMTAGHACLQRAEEQPEDIPLVVAGHMAKLELDQRTPLHDAAVQSDAMFVKREVPFETLVDKRDEQKGQ